VIVASHAGVPAELGIARDPRPLGVALRRVELQHGAKFMRIEADDDRLVSGFHHYEDADRLRWTDGCAELPAAMFARFDNGGDLMLQLGGSTRYLDEADGPLREAA
jgi:hypothetical protein